MGDTAPTLSDMPPRQHPDLAALLPSWELALRAERKAAATIKSYRDGVHAYLAWCAATGQPATLTRVGVQAFMAALLDQGASPATVTARQLGVKRFSAWLCDEQEQPTDPLIGLRAPRMDTRVVEPLSELECRRLIAACTGNSYRARRDEAIVRFMLETGTRAGEVISLAVADVNLPAGTVTVRRGKGGKGRVVPIGAQTVRAIDRYLRVRRGHRDAAGPALWLGDRNRGFTYYGLHWALSKRAEIAQIERFHPHMLRHTAAHRWLAAGGSEQGLMAVAGWSTSDMLGRYTRARASDRAAAEARTLDLGSF